jgi:hypothetical protein
MMTALCVALGAAGAAAAPIEDTFWAEKGDATNSLIDGGGSGYNNGQWYYYEHTLWWNEWFYDHPYDPTRIKVIDIVCDVTATEDGANVWVCANWSTPEWSQQGLADPPLPPLTPAEEALYIERSVPVVRYLADAGDTAHIEDHIVIPGYNPEWVSVDLWGNNYTVTGTIFHECIIPEPGCASVLVLGALAALRRRWTK